MYIFCIFYLFHNRRVDDQNHRITGDTWYNPLVTRILLIRHGDNDSTAQGKLAGWTAGVHLNERGREQASTLTKHLVSVPIKAIYSSPLLRTLETARPLAKAKNIPIGRCSGVAEVRYGSWQGQKLRDLRRRKLWDTVQHRPSAVTFPMGESISHAQARAVDAIDTICSQHPRDVIAIFSHSDVIKMILAHYLGLHLDLYQRIAIRTASISDLLLTSRAPMLLGANYIPGNENHGLTWDRPLS